MTEAAALQSQPTGKLDAMPSSCSAAEGGPPEDSFEQKRKQHYKMDLRAMKAAAEADDEDDEDDEDAKAGVRGADANDFGGGHWAIGPEALHGGPTRGTGFAQSTPGSTAAPLATRATEAPLAASIVAGPSSAPPAGEVHAQVAYCSEGAKQTPRAKKVLTWDEDTIAEHDLERGTRQKIEEPNTPWMGSPSSSARESAIHSSTPVAQPEDSDTQPVSATAVAIVEQDVQERLQTWFHQERHRVSIQEQWGDVAERASAAASQSDDLSLEEKKTRDFAEKRKQHYKVDLKAMRAAVDDSDDEDESEDDE